MFVIELIYNLSVLVALSIVSGFLYNRWSGNKTLNSVLQGILFGVVAMLGMLHPLVFDVGLVFDGRSVVVSLCGLYFGPVAAAISAAMAIALRFYQGGVGAIMGVSVITSSAIIGVLFYYRRRIRNRRISTLFLLGFGLIVHLVMIALTFTLPFESAISVIKGIGIEIIVFYPLATLLIGKILHDQEVKTQSIDSLRQSESLFRDLAQSSPIGICKVDNLGNVQFVNNRWCEIAGTSCGYITGKDFSLVVHNDDKEKVNSIWANSIISKDTFSIEFRVYKQHRPYWVFSHFEPIVDEYGVVTGKVGTIIDIDERKRVEDQLREWETIFLTTKTGVVVYRYNIFELDLMNPAFASMHGYTLQELKGKNIEELIYEEERSLINERIGACYQKGDHTFESRHIKKDGSIFTVLVTLSAVYDHDRKPLYIIANMQDITQMKEVEVILANEKLRLANIIEGTNVGTWEWDVQTGHIHVNERWAGIVGYSVEEIEPDTIDDWKKMVHPDDLQKATVLLEKHFRNQTDYYESEVRMKHKEGYWVWVQDRGKVTQWSSEGKPLMMYGIHIDISEKKGWEEKLKFNQQRLKEQNEEYLTLNEELVEINNRLRDSEYRLKEQNEEYLALNEELNESNLRIKLINKELKESRNKAEESDRLKSAFLANMSHEIRTPMNAIIGFSEILLRPNLSDEKQKLYAEVLNVSCNQLLGIINDVLDISKIETGQMTVTEGEVDVNRMLERIQTLFSHNARNKHNVIEILPEVKDKLIIRTDEAKLQQILNNLVSNAVKFTSRGGIEVGYEIKDDLIYFFVSDTGIGIDPQNYAIIFERFRQAENEPQKYHGGTGLGLAICKAFVEMLGGTIGVESEVGKGARFTFTIPCHQVFKSNETHKKKATTYIFKDKTILVAEDEPANFLFVSELIEETQATIIHVKNGAEAVEQVGLNPKIDLILMDVKMPIMDGVEATRVIRSMNMKIPIVALTAYALAGDKQRCLSAGCNAYVSKPVVKNELLQTMDRFLSSS